MLRTLIVTIGILGFLPASIAADQLDAFFGDQDGFGFATVVGLVGADGNPADRNGNSVLDEGDSLPDLDGDELINPDGGDVFDNQAGGDPGVTDAGIQQNTDLIMPFAFQIPQGHQIVSATVFIVVGDASLVNKALHEVHVDGIDTGSVLEPRQVGASGDGLITVTEVALSGSALTALGDGSANVLVTFSQSADDIAVDYARLQIETTPIPVPSLSLGGRALLAALLAWTGWRIAVNRRPHPSRWRAASPAEHGQ